MKQILVPLLLFVTFLVMGCAAEEREAPEPGRDAAPATASAPTADVEDDRPGGDRVPARAPASDQPPADDGWTAGITRVERREARVATVTDVRIALNEGFERVVLEMTGDGVPGYLIEYVDRPVRQCGSGHVVDLAGDGWLQIRLEPARAHTDAGESTVEERRREPRQPVIREAVMTCDFEAQVEWVLGVSSPNRYRVLELRSPTRLVVDIRSD